MCSTNFFSRPCIVGAVTWSCFVPLADAFSEEEKALVDSIHDSVDYPERRKFASVRGWTAPWTHLLHETRGDWLSWGLVAVNVSCLSLICVHSYGGSLVPSRGPIMSRCRVPYSSWQRAWQRGLIVGYTGPNNILVSTKSVRCTTVFEFFS